jgi:PKD repeat protein
LRVVLFVFDALERKANFYYISLSIFFKRTRMKKHYFLLFFLAMTLAAVSQPTGKKTRILTEKEIISEAKAKNIPDSDLKGYIAYRKSQQLKSNAQLNKIPAVTTTAVTMPACTNMDFETGNLTGWTGYTGLNPGCCTAPGTVTGRHTIVSGTGMDPIAPVTLVAPGGGSYSLQLGNSQTGAEAERIEQSFTVSPANALYTYQYALVLSASPHILTDQPYFLVEMYDVGNNPVPCGMDTIYPNDPDAIPVPNNPDAVYVPWRYKTVDLSAYIGQDVTVRFSTHDCTQGGHFGYAYIDGNCISGNQTSPICGGPATLTAATGAASYLWSPGGQTTQSIQTSTPGSYAVAVTYPNGCSFSQSFNVTQGSAASASFNMTINGTTVTLSNTSTAITPTYSWDFGDGTPISTLANPNHTYTANGTYNICLSVADSTGCTDVSCQQVTILSTGMGQDFNSLVSIYPNPSSSGIITVDLGKLNEKGAKIEVYDIIGNMVYERLVISNNNIDKYVVDLSTQAAGNYFMSIQTDAGMTTRRIWLTK